MRKTDLPRRPAARNAVALTLAALLAVALGSSTSGCAAAQDLMKRVKPIPASTTPSPAAASPIAPAPAASAAPVPSSAAAPAHSDRSSVYSPPPEPAAIPVESADQGAVEKSSLPTGPAIDRVVASVDGDPITMREVKDFGAQHGRPIETDDFASSESAKEVTKALIGQKLLEQEVKRYEEKVDDGQVEKYIQELRQDKHMTDAQFRAELQASGMSYDELRRRARLDLEKMMMIQQEVRSKINISNAEVEQAYEAHKADFTIAKERLRLAQILVATAPNATPAQVAAAQKKADDLHARAAKGEDFNDLARVYSDDASKSNGGELGWFEPSDVMDEILVAVKGLKPGQITPVIRTRHGFHIVKLEDHEVPGVRPYAEVKAQIRSQLVDQKSNDQLQSWIQTDLVKQHYVEILY
ncbi:MAG TPA: peptidylprolyl isomerase [Candidatus Acidoferrales bacterium]|nr:peptidylprolyl isomerase [Candidatus Acidoferrales bacterium]